MGHVRTESGRKIKSAFQRASLLAAFLLQVCRCAVQYVHILRLYVDVREQMRVHEAMI